MKNIEEQVVGELVHTAQERSALVHRWLKDLERLEQLDLPRLDEDLSSLIAARRLELQAKLAGELLNWHRLGGLLSLTVDGTQQAQHAQRAPRPVHQPAHEIEHAPPDPKWIEVLTDLLIAGRHSSAYSQELAALDATLERVDDWIKLPRKVQTTLIEWLTARLRHLQISQSERDWRVEQGFSVLTRYSRSNKPGFCYGLARDHHPRDESWAADAVALRERLRDAMDIGEATPADSQRMLQELQELVGELEQAPESAKEAVTSQLLNMLQDCLDEGLLARDPLLVAMVSPYLESFEGAPFKALRRAILNHMDHPI